MKAKHIITICGVILGGLAVAQGANATVTYQGSSQVQFTFNPVLSLSLSEGNFVIEKLTPGTSEDSSAVTATVSTNSSSGYVLAATVGNSEHNTTDLTSTGGRLAMMGSGTELTSGTWGYTLDGKKYGSLTLYSDTSTPATVLNKTVNAKNDKADGYAGGSETSVMIGAYANNDQSPGTYTNVVNFIVTGNVAAHTVAISTSGTNVASVDLDGTGANTGSYGEGTEVTISATCATDKTFLGWTKDLDYGTIANPNAASTTYTVGAGDVLLTPTCSQ